MFLILFWIWIIQIIQNCFWYNIFLSRNFTLGNTTNWKFKFLYAKFQHFICAIFSCLLTKLKRLDVQRSKILNSLAEWLSKMKMYLKMPTMYCNYTIIVKNVNNVFTFLLFEKSLQFRTFALNTCECKGVRLTESLSTKSIETRKSRWRCVATKHFPEIMFSN